MEINYSPDCLKNRELSWLDFNERVLAQADSREMPLFERLKFISIFTTNLDEFFMIRVGSLIDSMAFAPTVWENKTGMTGEEQLEAISKKVVTHYKQRQKSLVNLHKELEQEGIIYTAVEELSDTEKSILKRLFIRTILPLLSPQIVDNRHPFPHMLNKQLHVIVALKRQKRGLFGIVAIPQNLERIMFVDDDKRRYLLVEEVVSYFADIVFDMYTVVERTIAAVTRNADINTEEGLLDEDIDYRQHMKSVIRKRHRLAPVRLELKDTVSDSLLEYFMENLVLRPSQVFYTGVPIDLGYAFVMAEKLEKNLSNKLIWPPYVPSEQRFGNKQLSLINYVKKKDVMLSYPYQSMNPFLTLLRQAAESPTVISIKITLYRISRNSRLAETLMRAAENGKEVVVLMELRARFDENNNIEWARTLDEAGCRVIYGPAGYKVHSKICLITSSEHGKISYITQVGTGNYNEKTAKMYTDLSLITADQNIGKDAAHFFTNLMLGNLGGVYDHLLVAPKCLKPGILKLIDQEIMKAEQDKTGRIIIKCNSLTDKEIIEKLIEASCRGVRISMIIRGICCVVPKVAGFTENIEIISIVGKFLEHSRIFCFGQDDDCKMYISSADLMTRNTERRVEIACPIYEDTVKQAILTALKTMQADSVKAWEMLADGTYELRFPNIGQKALNSQEDLITQAKEKKEEKESEPQVPISRPAGIWKRWLEKLIG